ncbi:hypothetical protein C8R43DRAFT_942698 [Mycena crocata]|nr:hypothetical protein C8R43DRAFT_942698 [Mycena crocata]
MLQAPGGLRFEVCSTDDNATEGRVNIRILKGGEKQVVVATDLYSNEFEFGVPRPGGEALERQIRVSAAPQVYSACRLIDETVDPTSKLSARLAYHPRRTCLPARQNGWICASAYTDLVSTWSSRKARRELRTQQLSTARAPDSNMPHFVSETGLVVAFHTCRVDRWRRPGFMMSRTIIVAVAVAGSVRMRWCIISSRPPSPTELAPPKALSRSHPHIFLRFSPASAGSFTPNPSPRSGFLYFSLFLIRWIHHTLASASASLPATRAHRAFKYACAFMYPRLLPADAPLVVCGSQGFRDRDLEFAHRTRQQAFGIVHVSWASRQRVRLDRTCFFPRHVHLRDLHLRLSEPERRRGRRPDGRRGGREASVHRLPRQMLGRDLTGMDITVRGLGMTTPSAERGGQLGIGAGVNGHGGGKAASVNTYADRPMIALSAPPGHGHGNGGQAQHRVTRLSAPASPTAPGFAVDVA